MIKTARIANQGFTARCEVCHYIASLTEQGMD